MSYRRPVALLLPACMIFLSLAVLVSATSVYFLSLKRAASGSNTVVIGDPDNGLVIEPHHFSSLAFVTASMALEKSIRIVHAPAHIINLGIVYSVARRPFWFPRFIAPSAWTCLTFPVLALPAWSFVGLGIDGLLGHSVVRTATLVVSVILVLICGSAAAFLEFGLRGDPGLVPGYLEGFSMWTLLFAIPLGAWIRQRVTRSSDVTYQQREE